MDSYRFRKLTFILVFGILIPVCIMFHYPVIKGEFANILTIGGFIIVIISSSVAFYIHTLFPKVHKKAEDFNELLKEGPYKYLRHPFYTCFIFMGFGIALLFLSIPGFILNIFLISVWNKLAEKEERDLIEYWGDEYREIMKTRPRFFPRYKKSEN